MGGGGYIAVGGLIIVGIVLYLYSSGVKPSDVNNGVGGSRDGGIDGLGVRA